MGGVNRAHCTHRVFSDRGRG